jgi:hypothetical protein
MPFLILPTFDFILICICSAISEDGGLNEISQSKAVCTRGSGSFATTQDFPTGTGMISSFVIQVLWDFVRRLYRFENKNDSPWTGNRAPAHFASTRASTCDDEATTRGSTCFEIASPDSIGRATGSLQAFEGQQCSSLWFVIKFRDSVDMHAYRCVDILYVYISLT